jgi:hypothetical protein
MGFLDRLRGERKEVLKGGKVSLREAEDIIAKRSKKDFLALRESAKKEYDIFRKAADEMEDQLKALGSAEFPERTYEDLASRSASSRKNFIGRMEFLIKKLQAPLGESAESILIFCEEANKAITEANAEMTKDYAFVKVVFERESKEVLQNFKKIFEANERLGAVAKDIDANRSRLLRTRGDAFEISRISRELEGGKAGKLEERLRENEGEIKKYEGAMDALILEDAWKNFLKMQNEREALKEKMGRKGAEFTAYASKLEGPLKKYRKSKESKTLEDYIRADFESVLYDDPKGEFLAAALKDIKIMVIEGEMKLDESLIAGVDYARESNSRFLEEYQKLAEELRDIEAKLKQNEAFRRKGLIEKGIERLKKERIGIEGELKDAGEKMKRLQVEREQKAKELEEMLNYSSDKKLSLELNER